jgi:hypothetical protein
MSRLRQALRRFGGALFWGEFDPVGVFVAAVSEPIAKRLIGLGNALTGRRPRSESDPEAGASRRYSTS